MPNWTYNTIYADKEVIDAIVNEKGEVDFNKIIPMPEELNMTSGSVTNIAITYTVTQRLNVPLIECNAVKYLDTAFTTEERVKEYIKEKSEEECDQLFKDGQRYISNIAKYKAPTWYEWCCDNWGTKWNATESSRSEDNMISFNTAWSLPDGFYRELCKRFKNNTIAMYAEDEDSMEYICKNENGIFEIVEEAEDEYKLLDDEYNDVRIYVLEEKFFDNLPEVH